MSNNMFKLVIKIKFITPSRFAIINNSKHNSITMFSSYNIITNTNILSSDYYQK